MSDLTRNGNPIQNSFLSINGKVGGLGETVVVKGETDFPAPTAGVITIDRSYFVTDFIIMSPGVRMNFVGTEGAIVGVNAATAGLFFDVDGPAISGPMVLNQLTLDNPNVGASSKLINMTSTGGITTRVEYFSIRGKRAGTISNCFGAVTLDSCFINGALEGFKLDGIIGAFQAVYMTSGNTPAGFISWDVLATCTIVAAVTWRGCNFLTTHATDRGIRISSSATLPTGALPTTTLGALIIGCFTTGPGLTLEEGAGYVTVSDIDLWSAANGSLRDSNIHALTYFFNTTFFAQMIYTGIGTWDVMVSDNVTTGGSTNLILDASSERFSLVITSRQVWYVQYDGPQRGVELDLNWAVDVSSVTSYNDLEFRFTTQIGGVGAWVDLPNTHGLVQQVNRKQAIQGGGTTTINPGDRFRLEVRPLVAANNSEYYRIQIQIG